MTLGDRRVLSVLIAVCSLVPSIAYARSTASPPPLPAPSGTVVNVASEAQLQSAIQNLSSNTTIVIAPGTYVLSRTLYIDGAFTNVGIRGATNNRDDVVLVGPGMTKASYGNVPYGIWTGDGVNGILIANLTIRDLYYHPIIFNAGTQNPHVYNVHLIDAGQQFIKSNPDSAGNGVNYGIVEYSVLEYTTAAPTAYTNGVDVHGGIGWVIRHNLFRNIVGPLGQLAGPAILMWNHARDTITEGNMFVNCARGISYGMEEISPGTDHSGGIIRNNFFFRASGQSGDVAIAVFDSPNTQVLNNTIFVSGTYGSPIEYRFPETTGVVIANNITDGIISARDGATATVTNNVPGATAGLFVNAAAGDLHLASTATSAIDRGATTSAVTDDWDGDLRPYGPAYDIGADERGATSASYQIAGHVTDGTTGAAMAAVTVSLSGARSQSTTTDAAGGFSFTGLAGGVDYTVTPVKASVGFSPASEFFSALAADQTSADFRGFPVATPPTVSLSAPAPGATYTAPASITIGANASTSSGSVTKVDFYANSALIGSDATAPYSITWGSVPAGSYALTAVATTSTGATAQSAPISVLVNPSSTPVSPPPPTTSSGCPCSIWSASTVPGRMENDNHAVELGVKFQADRAGFVTGLRFYKYSQNTGRHYGHLWSASGALLATVRFENETASGWQEAHFSTPVAITAGTTYVISYHTRSGFYAQTINGLASAVSNGPLHALASGTSGGNGVFAYGGFAYPSQTWYASNYWVDVIFEAK